MGKKSKKPADPTAHCPKCNRVQKVIHSRRQKPFPEDTSICKTCHTQFPRWMGVETSG